MQTGAWIGLLHQIPKNQYDNLVFTTTAGIEIAVQGVQRIEADYILVRGRQTGVVTESGGFFFIPYDRILFLGFQKVVPETVIRRIYGDHTPAEPLRDDSSEPIAIAEVAAVEDQAALESIPAATSFAAAPSDAAKPTMANKAELLERLRARRSEAGPASVKP